MPVLVPPKRISKHSTVREFGLDPMFYVADRASILKLICSRDSFHIPASVAERYHALFPLLCFGCASGRPERGLALLNFQYCFCEALFHIFALLSKCLVGASQGVLRALRLIIYCSLPAYESTVQKNSGFKQRFCSNCRSYPIEFEV